MDTPIIAQYYREKDPAKRRELLEQAIAQLSLIHISEPTRH